MGPDQSDGNFTGEQNVKTTIKAFLRWHKYGWKEIPDFHLYPSDMSSAGPEYVLIKEMDVDVEVPDNFDPVPAQVEALKKEKQKILADAHVKAENIEEQIQRLLCIEFKPEVK